MLQYFQKYISEYICDIIIFRLSWLKLSSTHDHEQYNPFKMSRLKYIISQLSPTVQQKVYVFVR